MGRASEDACAQAARCLNIKKLKDLGGNLTRNKFATLSMSALMFAGAAPCIMASAPVIGMASAQSGATLDDSRVSGTATLFEGSKIKADGYSRLHLNNGTRLDLAAGSQAQVFAKYASLESGTSEIEGVSGYEIDAHTLKIQLAEKNSIARVKIDTSDNRVYVTALNASVNVRNSQGLLVAKVAPGLPFSFLPQGAAAANSFDSTGCVLQKNGAAIISDDSGSQVTELRGFDLRKSVGKRTHVMGSVDATATPAAGASQVVNVTSAMYSNRSDCRKVAGLLGASTAAAGLAAGVGAGAAGAGAATAGAVGAAAGAAAAGIGTTAAVVGGVAAAAAATV